MTTPQTILFSTDKVSILYEEYNANAVMFFVRSKCCNSRMMYKDTQNEVENWNCHECGKLRTTTPTKFDVFNEFVYIARTSNMDVLYNDTERLKEWIMSWLGIDTLPTVIFEEDNDTT